MCNTGHSRLAPGGRGTLLAGVRPLEALGQQTKTLGPAPLLGGRTADSWSASGLSKGHRLFD